MEGRGQMRRWRSASGRGRRRRGRGGESGLVCVCVCVCVCVGGWGHRSRDKLELVAQRGPVMYGSAGANRNVSTGKRCSYPDHPLSLHWELPKADKRNFRERERERGGGLRR